MAIKLSNKNQQAASAIINDLIACAQLTGKYSESNREEHRHWLNEMVQAHQAINDLLNIDIANRYK